MMKKKFSLVLSLFVVLASCSGLAACNNAQSGSSNGSSTSSPSVQSSAASSQEPSAGTASVEGSSQEPSVQSSVEPSSEASVEASVEPSSEASVEASSEQPSEDNTETDQPEQLLSLFEEEINGLLKNNEPLDSSLINTTFESNFILPDYQHTLNGAVEALNDELSSIFKKANFVSRYGAIPDEVFEYDGYQTVDFQTLKLAAKQEYFNMPEIEEVRLYPVEIYMSIGSQKRKWTTTKWYFIKTGGKWYLDYSDTDISL